MVLGSLAETKEPRLLGRNPAYNLAGRIFLNSSLFLMMLKGVGKFPPILKIVELFNRLSYLSGLRIVMKEKFATEEKRMEKCGRSQY